MQLVYIKSDIRVYQSQPELKELYKHHPLDLVADIKRRVREWMHVIIKVQTKATKRIFKADHKKQERPYWDGWKMY
jgi:hypothetical protein